MIINFAFYLTLTVLLTGVVTLLDVCWWRRHRQTSMPGWIMTCRSLFPVLLVVLLFRSFVMQPYRVPTGSLEPTIMPGDFIAVSQFDYGLHFPVGDKVIYKTGKPKRGDIVLFRWPVNPSINYVKRVIGLPGDHIHYANKRLTINGKPCTLRFVGHTVDQEPGGGLIVDEYQEDLLGVKHRVLINPYTQQSGDFDYTVPKGQYFVMGDNRDNSNDSRGWGAVPYANLIGKARMIWMSWNNQRHAIEWHRLGRRVG